MGTKTKILDTSLRLFNKNGVQNVSMRDIADEVSISPGNLTYHFRKREEIVLNLYFQFYETFQKPGKFSPSPLDLFKTLFKIDEKLAERSIQYSFVLFDHVYLVSNFEKIRIFHNNLMNKREAQLTAMFNHLSKEGFFIPPDNPQTYAMLAQRHLIIGNYWLLYPQIDRQNFSVKDFNFVFSLLKEGLKPYVQKPYKKYLTNTI